MNWRDTAHAATAENVEHHGQRVAHRLDDLADTVVDADDLNSTHLCEIHDIFRTHLTGVHEDVRPLVDDGRVALVLDEYVALVDAVFLLARWETTDELTADQIREAREQLAETDATLATLEAEIGGGVGL